MSREVWQNGILREWWNDATRTVTVYDSAGVQTSTRPYTASENALADTSAAAETARINETALRDKARNALTNNATFLADGSVTQAEAVAQVQKLTRQVNALIKLEVRELADQNGT